MIGFPAQYGEIYESNLGPHGITRIISGALDDLGWQYSISEDGVFTAKTGISGLSWGEIVTVSIEDDLIRLHSKCLWPMQIIDWGKNKANVRNLFAHLQKQELRYKSMGPGSADREFETDSSSRVEKLFAEDKK